MVTLNQDVLAAARTIYDFHHLGQQAVRADAIIALGTNDLRVAEHAADLFERGFGEWLICTGGVAHQNDLLAAPWTGPESEAFAAVAAGRGVPRERIVLESEALNTAENFRFVRRLIAERGMNVRNIAVAVKPFMQRRAATTIAVEWPEMAFSLSSPVLSMDEYFTDTLPAERMIHIFMGDLQRIWIYARKGWSAPQQIPDEVLDAYRFLKFQGWTNHLIAGDDFA